jgi:hypothetical protein
MFLVLLQNGKSKNNKRMEGCHTGEFALVVESELEYYNNILRFQLIDIRNCISHGDLQLYGERINLAICGFKKKLKNLQDNWKNMNDHEIINYIKAKRNFIEELNKIKYEIGIIPICQ